MGWPQKADKCGGKRVQVEVGGTEGGKKRVEGTEGG